MDQIGQLPTLEDGRRWEEAAELAALRLADVRARLADPAAIEAALAKLLGECGAREGRVSCTLIAALARMAGAPQPCC